MYKSAKSPSFGLLWLNALCLGPMSYRKTSSGVEKRGLVMVSWGRPVLHEGFLSNFTVMKFFNDLMVEQTCSPLLYHLDSIRSINPPFCALLCDICIRMPASCQFSRRYWTGSNTEPAPTRAIESSNSELAYPDAGTLCEWCYNYLPPVLDYSFLTCSGLHDEGEHLEELRIGRCLNKTNQNIKQWRITVKTIQK